MSAVIRFPDPDTCRRCGASKFGTHHPLCEARDGTPTNYTDAAVRRRVRVETKKEQTTMSKVTKLRDDTIAIELEETNFFTRWPCTVCGGRTEKTNILAEGEQHYPDGTYRTVRVCETCIENPDGAGDIDERLRQHANRLLAESQNTRELIGRLVVPTAPEYYARSVEVEVNDMRRCGDGDNEIVRMMIDSFADPFCTNKYDRQAKIDWLIANGMTPPEIESAIELRRKQREFEQARQRRGDIDLPF